MPAHDSLEHCAVVGYLCQPNGSKIPARRSGRAGCTQACLQDHPPTARHVLVMHRTPRKEGHRSHYLHFAGVEREVGEICHPGHVRAGISGYGSQLSATCIDHASWNRFWGRFLFL